jgi:hypothetical protein
MKALFNQFTAITHYIFSLRIAALCLRLEQQKQLKAIGNMDLLVVSNEALRTRPRRLTAFWG